MCGATTTSGMMINGVYLVFEVTLCLTNRGTDSTRVYCLLGSCRIKTMLQLSGLVAVFNISWWKGFFCPPREVYVWSHPMNSSLVSCPAARCVVVIEIMKGSHKWPGAWSQTLAAVKRCNTEIGVKLQSQTKVLTHKNYEETTWYNDQSMGVTIGEYVQTNTSRLISFRSSYFALSLTK